MPETLGPSPEEMGIRLTKPENLDNNPADKEDQAEILKAYPWAETAFEAGVSFAIQVHEKKFETLVFMDRSARPLAGLINVIWKRLFPNEQPPNIKFMHGTAHRQVDDASNILADRFPKEDFNGKRVLLVDEFIESGGSVLRAEALLKKAFPEIEYMGAGTFLEKQYPGGEYRKRKELPIDIVVNSGAMVGDALSSEYGNRNVPLPGYLTEKDTTKGSLLQPFTVPNRSIVPTKSREHIFRQIGKHIRLNQEQLESIKQDLADSLNISDPEYQNNLSQVIKRIGV